MTDADWLAAVAAAPDDPLVRLAYADWLDDRGDPRGELLRLDVRLAGLADDDSTAEPIRRRLAELTLGTAVRWRAAVCRVPLRYDGWLDHGGCTCVLPGEYAGLFEYEFPGHHALQRQPATRSELLAVCAAARACRGAQVRYGGDDPVVRRLLGYYPAGDGPVPGSVAAPHAGRPPPDATPWPVSRRPAHDLPADELTLGACLTVALAALVVVVALACFVRTRLPVG